jgi:hypothetical protein
MKKIILIVVVVFMLSGCYVGETKYGSMYFNPSLFFRTIF